MITYNRATAYTCIHPYQLTSETKLSYITQLTPSHPQTLSNLFSINPCKSVQLNHGGRSRRA